jgi:LytS/YehU family sensor histidine kinase
MDAKKTAFIAMMSSLGLALSIITLNVGIFSVAVPGQAAAALDLSHIATFVAAIFGGPLVGGLVGFIGGLYAGYYFGYVVGSLGLLSLIGTPFGKALTGVTSGFLYKKLNVGNRSRSAGFTIPVVLVSYVPECVFTIFYFLYVVMWATGSAWWFMLPLVIPKAWIEITIMSLIMAALVGNNGFKEFMVRFLGSSALRKLAS